MRTVLVTAAVALASGLAMPAFAMAPAAFIPQGATKLTDRGSTTEYDIAAEPVQVDAFYRHVLPDQGFNLTDDVLSPTSISFYFSRGSNSEGSVMIRVRGDVSHVVLTLTD